MKYEMTTILVMVMDALMLVKLKLVGSAQVVHQLLQILVNNVQLVST
jgi:hypothetical protein